MSFESIELLKKITVIWLVIDIVEIATIWYLISTVRPLIPGFWQQYICRDLPVDFEYF